MPSTFYLIASIQFFDMGNFIFIVEETKDQKSEQFQIQVSTHCPKICKMQKLSS